MLYRSTDRLCRSGAPMENLCHSASFESDEKNAPSKSGTKQLVRESGDDGATSNGPEGCGLNLDRDPVRKVDRVVRFARDQSGQQWNAQHFLQILEYGRGLSPIRRDDHDGATLTAGEVLAPVVECRQKCGYQG